MSDGTCADRGATDFSNTLSAGCQQRTKNKKKAIKHEKPNEYEPRYPFQPRIGLGPGHLVSSSSASRRACGGEKHDGGQNDGTLPGNEGTETENDGRHEGSRRSTHRAAHQDEPRAGEQEDRPDARCHHAHGGAAITMDARKAKMEEEMMK